MKEYVLGIDFGTLSGRALVVDADNGKETADAEYVYANGVIDQNLPGEKKRLEPDTALQDPNDYLEVLRQAVPKALKKAKIRPEQVIGIGTDFTASSPLPCCADGTPLCFDKKWRKNPHAWVKLWKHHAGQPEADEINALGRRRNEHFLTVYGGKYSSEWFFSKLLQVARDAPELYDAMGRWIEACDWIVWQMTGRETRSLCAAGYKAMWVYPHGEGWAYPAPDFFEELHPKLGNVIGEKLHTQLHQLGQKAGGLTAEMAEITGLKEGTPVSIGNVDAHAAVPACTVTSTGKMVNIMGTSTCNMLLGDEFQPVEGMCGAVKDGIIPGFWGYEAGQSAVGDIFAWYIENGVPSKWKGKGRASPAETHEILSGEAGKLKAGQSGLLALDWWNGNRSVLVDTTLSGCIFGLTLASTPPEIYRALIESTAFGQRKIIDAFESHGVRVHEVYACGGLAAKNPVLMQIYADVIGRPIFIAESAQTCALGSAMHGAVACGRYPDIREAAGKMARIKRERYEPEEASHAAYQPLYGEYSRLHDLLGRHRVPVMKTLKNLRA